jgi:hypothetical protein
MKLTNCDLAIASERFFGPHPSAFLSMQMTNFTIYGQKKQLGNHSKRDEWAFGFSGMKRY